MKRVFASLFFALSVFFTASLGVAENAEVGKPAPPFSLQSIEGKTVSLDTLKGKTVVLEWFNSGCPFVRKHYLSHHMQGLQEKYSNQGVVWLLVSSSAKGKQGYGTPEEHQEKFNEWKIKAQTLLIDADGTVGKRYGAKVTPHLSVIDKNGVLAYQGAPDSIPSTEEEDLPKATSYIAQALDELLSGKPVSTASTEAYGCSVKYAS